MRRYFPYVQFFFIFTLLLGSQMFADGPLSSDPSGVQNVLPGSEYYIESERVLQYPEIQSENFQKTSDEKLNFGYCDCAVWIRFEIQTEVAMQRLLELSNTQTDSIEVFIESKSGVFQRQGGDRKPFREREVQHRGFLFHLDLPEGKSTIYVRVQSAGALFIEMSLMSWEAFQEKNKSELYSIGIYFGILLLIIFQNLFMFLYVRDRSYLAYIIYILAYGIFQLSINGAGYEYLWPDFPSIQNLISPLSALAALFFAAIFTRYFLLTAVYTPLFDRLLRIFASVCFLVFVAAPFISYNLLSRIAGFLSLPFALTALPSAIIVFRQGYRPARFFLYGWSLFLFEVVLFSLFMAGYLPDVFLTRNGIQVGSALQMILLSLGLADRMNEWKMEKERAQRRVVEQQKALLRMQENMNVRLEKEVRLKTQSLESANDALKKRETMVRMELRLASEIQKGIMPPGEFENDIFFLAAGQRCLTEVGGDFFDVYNLGGRQKGVLIADVSGHGIPAALVSAMAKISFMNAALRQSSPARILEIVNRELVRSITARSYLTCVFIAFEEKLAVTYSGAAHPNPLLFRRKTGEIAAWHGEGFMVGGLEEIPIPYTNHFDRLEKGDRLLLYTDGLTESRAANGSEFGTERLIQAFRDSVQIPPHEARNFIFARFDAFLTGSEIEDDVTVLLLEMK